MPEPSHDLEYTHFASITPSLADEPTMSPNRSTLTVHTSVLFDPIQKAFLDNVSVEVNTETGAIIRLHHRNTPDLISPLSSRDIDLRSKIVFPGFVDSHTHIFLHADR
jgi:cytosine/adenosine deaminase-related metal-dependent hydrolase